MILFIIIFFILLSSLAYPVQALETESKIHTEEAVFDVGESYELYQGYSFRIIEPSPSGNKINMEILLDGESVDDSIFINKDTTYQHTKEYDNETYLIFNFLLKKIYMDDWTVKLNITQYIDPSRSTSEFLIFDKEQTIELDTFLSLKQDYSLKLAQMDSDYVVIELYKDKEKLKEQEMEIDDTFDYTITVNDREYSVLTFELDSIFMGTTRNVVLIHHLYQFGEPSVPDPVETVSSISEDNGSALKSINSSPTPTPDDTNLPESNSTVVPVDHTINKPTSLIALTLFAATVILVFVWADSISKRRKK